MANGPVLENIDRDDEVDLFKFPVPRLHEKDGGRYIGTDDLVIMRDPDSDWVNAATYRVQVHDTTRSASGSRRASTGARSATNTSRPGSPARC